MQTELFSYLAEQGFSRAKAETINEETFASWKIDDYGDFLENLLPLIPRSYSKAAGPLEFITNSSLAGGKHPCAAVACRLEAARKLADFAALYAKTVLIPDPFELLVLRDVDIDVLRHEVYVNILIFLALQPLIESGIIKFSRSSFSFCQSCYRNIVGELDNVWKQKIENLDQHLYERYVNEVDFTALDEDGSISVKVEGPPDLVEHGITYLHFFDVPNYVKRKSRGKSPKFSKKNLHAHKDLIRFFTNTIVEDVWRQNFYTSLSNHSYLTQRDIEFDAARYLSSTDSDIVLSPGIARKSLPNISYSLPILPNVDLPTLVKLRLSEIEAFSVYQDSLSEALTNVQGARFDDYQTISLDVIEPNIHKIEYEVKKARRRLKLSIGEDVVMAAGVVGIGLFSGVLPPNIGQIIGAIGGFHYGREVLSKVRKLLSESDVAMANNFYFLWKARKASKRHATKGFLELM